VDFIMPNELATFFDTCLLAFDANAYPFPRSKYLSQKRAAKLHIFLIQKIILGFFLRGRVIFLFF